MKTFRFCLLGFLLILGSSALGVPTGLPQFTAICDTERVVRYDKLTRYGDGKVINDGWGDDGFGPWQFEYRGGSSLLVDDKPVPIVAASASSVLATTTYPGGFDGVVQWSYAVNLNLGTAVGTNILSNAQAQGSIKVRAWNMDCQIR